MGLSLTQRREAAELQRRGRTLREIARHLELSFEEVCLSLYGGIHDWEPRIGQPVPTMRLKVVTPLQLYDLVGREDDEAELAALEEQEKNDDDDLGGEGAAGLDDGADGEPGADAGRAAEPGGSLADGELGNAEAELQPAPDRTSVRPLREQGGAAPAPQPARPVEPPAEPPASAAEAPHAPAAAGVPPDDATPVRGVEAEPAPRRYRLTNGAGEYLHKSGSGMTRNRDAAWSGTAQQMEEAFKRKPTLKDLDPERVV